MRMMGRKESVRIKSHHVAMTVSRTLYDYHIIWTRENHPPLGMEKLTL